MEGRARDFFNNFGPETKASASRIFDELELHFNSSAIRYQAKTLLHERVQKQNESVCDFYQNISVLGRKAWAILPRGEEREKLLECFVRGLKANIRKIFFDHEPRSIEEALRLAEAREIYLRTKIKGLANVNAIDNEGMTKKVRWEDNQGTVQSLRKELDGLKIKLAERDTQIEAMDSKIKTLLDNTSKSERSMDTSQRARSNSPRPRNGPPSCWGCGATTHFRAECPHKGGK